MPTTEVINPPCQCEECRSDRGELPARCSRCRQRECRCCECAACGVMTPRRCPDCDGGLDCCGCHCVTHDDDNGDDRELQPGDPFRDGKKRLVGVELEYNDANSATIRNYCRKWRAGDHYDGSCGREIVTPPMSGKYIDEIMAAMGQTLKDAGATCNDSCGIHVHVDAADFKWEDMYRLLHVYARVEPILYILGGQTRVANQYCAPTGIKYAEALASIDRKGDILAVAYRDKYGDNVTGASSARQYVRERRPGKKDQGRYKGLNICPWLAGRRANSRGPRNKPVKKDTTVEFRLHKGTLDTHRVAEWAKVCERLVSWCATATNQEAKNLPKSALRALLLIAPESKDWIMRRMLAWRKALPKGEENRTYPRRVAPINGKWAFVNVNE